MLLSGIKTLFVPSTPWNPAREQAIDPSPHFVAQAGKATELILPPSRDSEEIYATHLPYFTSLRTLDLSYSLTSAFTASIAAHLPYLQVLRLQRTYIGNDGVTALLRCRNLRFLDISECHVTGQGITAAASIPTLTALYASDNKVSIESVSALAASSSLTLLELNGCRLNERQHMSDHFTSLTNLVHLSLSLCDIDDRAASYLALLPRVTYLCLADNYLTYCPAFSRSVGKQLRTLNLACNRLDDVALQNCLSTQSFPSLTELILYGLSFRNHLSHGLVQSSLLPLPVVQLNAASQRSPQGVRSTHRRYTTSPAQDFYKPVINPYLCHVDLPITEPFSVILERNGKDLLERKQRLILVLLSASYARRRYLQGKGSFFYLSRLPIDLLVYCMNFLPPPHYRKSPAQCTALASFICAHCEELISRVRSKKSVKVVERLRLAEWDYTYGFAEERPSTPASAFWPKFK